MSAPRRRATGSITFVQDGETRAVDLGAPMPVWRGGSWVVRLMDLWVATMLPGDVFDLCFKLVTSPGPHKAGRAALVDGLLFARGYVAVRTRELWWEDPGDSALAGFRAHAIVVRREVERPREPPLAKATAPRPAPAVPLERLLPLAAVAYPAIEWRRAGGS